MSAALLDGNAFLAHVKENLHERVLALGERGITPGLATVLVGGDLNSAAYVRMKHEDCAEIGINSFREDLPATSTQAEVIAAINRCNLNPEIDGFIVQLPLPTGRRLLSAFHLPSHRSRSLPKWKQLGSRPRRLSLPNVCNWQHTSSDGPASYRTVC